ncbi:MAG: AtpZ/AtpI family protein [Planctomycetaceae bacterium]|nr:AtpZ/AtpI family protein [Planctomycetaceae bacterium]
MAGSAQGGSGDGHDGGGLLPPPPPPRPVPVIPPLPGARSTEAKASGVGKFAGSGTMAGYGIGVEFLVYVVVCVVGGWALDKAMGTGKVWTLVGAALGVLGGGWRTIRAAMKLNATMNAQTKHKRK